MVSFSPSQIQTLHIPLTSLSYTSLLTFVIEHFCWAIISGLLPLVLPMSCQISGFFYKTNSCRNDIITVGILSNIPARLDSQRNRRRNFVCCEVTRTGNWWHPWAAVILRADFKKREMSPTLFNGQWTRHGDADVGVAATHCSCGFSSVCWNFASK